MLGCQLFKLQDRQFDGTGDEEEGCHTVTVDDEFFVNHVDEVLGQYRRR